MNYHLFAIVNGWAGRHDAVDDAMEFFATVFIYVIFAGAAVPAVQALLRRRFRALVLCGASLALAFAVAFSMSHLSDEPRPFQTHHVVQLIPHDPGVSLPSDHATAAFTVATATAVFLHRGWGLVLGVCACIIGFARVWVGVHYPGDIAAAATIAVAAVALVYSVDRIARRRSSARPAKNSATA